MRKIFIRTRFEWFQLQRRRDRGKRTSWTETNKPPQTSWKNDIHNRPSNINRPGWRSINIKSRIKFWNRNPHSWCFILSGPDRSERDSSKDDISLSSLQSIPHVVETSGENMFNRSWSISSVFHHLCHNGSGRKCYWRGKDRKTYIEKSIQIELWSGSKHHHGSNRLQIV